jgi:hypothetical protein
MALKLIMDAALEAPKQGAGSMHIGAYKPLDDSVNHYLKGREILSSSSTAVLIEKTLMESDKVVGVLFTDQADSMHIPAHVLENHDTLKMYTGGIALVNPASLLKPSSKWQGAQAGGGELPLGVSLFHELGHAKQGVEKKVWYDELTRSALTGSKNAKLQIEQDNLASHENPICDELGLPFRRKYDD